MKAEEFLKDVCPNHTETSKWNKSELLNILDLHKEQLLIQRVVGQSEQLVCGHPNNKVTYFQGHYHCQECNGKWKGI